jgi:hypothetical protein
LIIIAPQSAEEEAESVILRENWRPPSLPSLFVFLWRRYRFLHRKKRERSFASSLEKEEKNFSSKTGFSNLAKRRERERGGEGRKEKENELSSLFVSQLLYSL